MTNPSANTIYIDTSQKEACKIDPVSQQFILYLLEKGPVRASGVWQYLSGAQNSSAVNYRVRKHLRPAGLVEVAETVELEGGVQDARVYKLTNEGRELVRAHLSEIKKPYSLDDLYQTALSAEEKAESSKNSIHKEQKKRHNLKSRVEEIQEGLRKLESILDRKAVSQSKHHTEIDALQEQIDEMSDDLQQLGDITLRAHADSQQNRCDVSRLLEEVEDLRAALTEVTDENRSDGFTLF